MMSAPRKSAALLMFVVFAFSGCINTDTMPVDYGAETSASAINAALVSAKGVRDPLLIQEGEFVGRAYTQDLANGASFSIIAEGGITVTERDENANRVVFQGVTHDVEYKQDGTYSKVSRQGELGCVSKVACGCGECNVTQSLTKTSSLIEQLLQPSMAKMISHQEMKLVTPENIFSDAALRVRANAEVSTAATPTPAPTPAPTFHKLQTWTSKVAPPLRVQRSPNCAGIPNCEMEIRHVSYDMVSWADPKGSKVHVETSYSPQAPFFANEMSVCQSLLVNVGDKGNNILLKQCSEVFDFKFKTD